MPYDSRNIRPNNSGRNKLIYLTAALGTLMVAASTCSGAPCAQDVLEPIWPTKEWQTSSPEEQGMDSKELAKVVDFGASLVLSTTGTTPSSALDSLLIVRHGKIVVEAYYAPFAAGILHQVNSVTTIDMHLEPGLRYSNCFWALPEKHVCMADGYRGQLIMVFPDLDVVAVTTGRANFSLNEITDLISSSVKSDTSLSADAASVKVLADKILDVSTEKPTSVGPAPKLASIISGKIYRFPPNKLYLKSLALMLTENQPSYDIETYVQDTTKPGPKFTGPIGLHGLYRKGELTYQGADNPFFGGPPRVRVVNAVKGTWVDDHTFVVDCRVLGLANYPEERWTLTFDGEKLNIRVNFGTGPEISIDGETGA
jgi:hypothetical protein